MTRPKTLTPLRTTLLSLAILIVLPITPQTQATGGPPSDTFTGHDCFESHAYFAADPDDFDRMPEGFSLARDETGQGTIAAITRACDDGAVISTLAVVLVHAPASLEWSGADHAILLSPSMVNDATLHDRLTTWGVTVPRLTPMTVSTNTLADTLVESRTQADPDFLIAIQATGDHETLPLSQLRTFQMDLDTRELTAAYDTQRPSVAGVSGTASVHFVYQGPGDFPDHRLGTGAIMLSKPVDILFRPANHVLQSSAP